jgi:hypothetical protein
MICPRAGGPTCRDRGLYRGPVWADLPRRDQLPRPGADTGAQPDEGELKPARATLSV